LAPLNNFLALPSAFSAWPLQTIDWRSNAGPPPPGGDKRPVALGGVCLRSRPMMDLREILFAVGALTTATALLEIVGKLVF
jgi:hypothetical protein